MGAVSASEDAAGCRPEWTMATGQWRLGKGNGERRRKETIRSGREDWDIHRWHFGVITSKRHSFSRKRFVG
jgi:hypothetical protein